MKIIKKLSIVFFMFFLILIFNYKVQSAYLKEGIENFPESYKPYLEVLKERYPNWNFTALYTELDWNYVIDNENIFGKNLVPKSYSDEWKNTNPGEYNVEVDSRLGRLFKKSSRICNRPKKLFK